MPAQFLRGNLAALFTAVVWALTYAATKSLYAHVSPIDVIVLRFSVALVCLTGIAIAAHEPLRIRSAGDALLLALAGLFGFTLYFLLQNTALGYTQAANVAILASLVPIFNVLIMKAFFRSTPLTKRFFAGSALAIAGSVCITVSTVGLPQASPFGDALTLASCLVFPLYNVCVTKLADRGYGVLATTVWAFFFGLLFTLPAEFIAGPKFTLETLMIPDVALGILFLGIFASAACYITWNYAVRLIGIAGASIWIYSEPLIAAAVSVLVLGESLPPLAIAGTAVIIMGLALSQKK